MFKSIETMLIAALAAVVIIGALTLFGNIINSYGEKVVIKQPSQRSCYQTLSSEICRYDFPDGFVCFTKNSDTLSCMHIASAQPNVEFP